MPYLKSKLRRLLNRLNKQNRKFRVTSSIKKHWYGNSYGGFYTHPTPLTPESTVYSFGIGEDISFDREIIERHKCIVHGFDPTPKSADWVSHNVSDPKFVFHNIGIGRTTQSIDFYLPKNTNHVSGCFTNQHNTDPDHKIVVLSKSFDDIVQQLDHKHIDILKMDIEGTEYDILEPILDHPIEVTQILIEFHSRFFDDGEILTQVALDKLKSCGYEIFGISDSFEEISFIKKDTIIRNRQ